MEEYITRGNCVEGCQQGTRSDRTGCVTMHLVGSSINHRHHN